MFNEKNLLLGGIHFVDNNIATVKAIYNSASSINRYSEKFEAFILNNIGEWDFAINERNNYLFHNIGKNILKFLPKYGFKVDFLI